MLKLLQFEPKQRIGYGSINEIKEHPFFWEFDWEALSKMEMESPLLKII